MKLYNCLGALAKSKEMQVCNKTVMEGQELPLNDHTVPVLKLTLAHKAYLED